MSGHIGHLTTTYHHPTRTQEDDDTKQMNDTRAEDTVPGTKQCGRSKKEEVRHVPRLPCAAVQLGES